MGEGKWYYGTVEHLGYKEAADAIVAAFEAVLAEGDTRVLTPDLRGSGSTQALGQAIAERIAAG